MATDQLITVHGEAELFARIAHLFTGMEREFSCAANDMNTWSEPRRRAQVAGRMRARVDEGFTARKLYTSAALADEEQRLHLLEVAEAGAQVRISAAPLPHEVMIIDRRVLILAGPRRAGDREFTATTSAAMLATTLSLFEGLWQASTELAGYLRQDLPDIDAGGRAILRALASGRTDEAAARELGVSLRTYRRRVAALMSALEAESRFQAGVRAGRLGLTG